MPFLMCNRIGRHPDTDLHLFQGFLVSQNDAGHDRGRRAMKAVAHRLHDLEVFMDEFNELLVLQMSRSSDDEVPR